MKRTGLTIVAFSLVMLLITSFIHTEFPMVVVMGLLLVIILPLAWVYYWKEEGRR
jgi:hypothetical protein